MTTDRELLELAARAEGSNESRWFSDDCFQVRRQDRLWDDWNPLTDDGDEARLEASLCFHVEWHPMLCTVTVGTAKHSATEPWGSDRQAARRRAGTRAAAEIARAQAEGVR